ncbi:hypothetical protein B0H34DRAFT_678968 [Crassisporium funariophilum]|nr:hypothetical protein B0H34DRAFT_678968 [Crassisporium funariophilum]
MPPKPPDREYYCDCTKCMRGGRTQPKKVARATYNRHCADRTPQIQTYSQFLEQHGYQSHQQAPVPNRGPLLSASSKDAAWDIRRQGHSGGPPNLDGDGSEDPDGDDDKRSDSGSEKDRDRDSDQDRSSNEPEDRPLQQEHNQEPDDMYETMEEEQERLEQERLMEEARNNNQDIDGGQNVPFIDPGSIEDLDRWEPLRTPELQHGHANPGPGGVGNQQDGGGDPDQDIEVKATLEELKLSQEFISALRDASLDRDRLPEEIIDRLRHPQQTTYNLDKEPEL